MPDFKIHVTSGSLAGVALAATGIISQDLTPVQAGAVVVLGTTGGVLPDLDSDTGKPLALLFQWLSILIPVLTLPYLEFIQHRDTPFMLCYFPAVYGMIHYVICPLVKKITRHRGMMHSVPFAFICAEASYLFLMDSGLTMAFYGGLSILLGCMVHLLLDELASLDFKNGFVVVAKRSSGSALKLFGSEPFGTVFTYLIWGGLTWVLILKLFPDIRATMPGGTLFG